MGVPRSIYPRNCALFEESTKVSMDKLWIILNKFRGGHKSNMQISGRGTSFQNGYQRRGIALIMENDNSNWSFGWGLRTPNLGEEEAVGGRGWYRSKDR